MEEDFSSDLSTSSSVNSDFSTRSQLVGYLCKKSETIARDAKHVFREAKAIFKKQMKESAQLLKQADVTAGVVSNNTPINNTTPSRPRKRKREPAAWSNNVTITALEENVGPPIPQLISIKIGQNLWDNVDVILEE